MGQGPRWCKRRGRGTRERPILWWEAPWGREEEMHIHTHTHAHTHAHTSTHVHAHSPRGTAGQQHLFQTQNEISVLAPGLPLVPRSP